MIPTEQETGSTEHSPENRLGKVPFIDLLFALATLIIVMFFVWPLAFDYLKDGLGLEAVWVVALTVIFQNSLLLCAIRFFILRKNQLEWSDIGFIAIPLSKCLQTLYLVLPLVVLVGAVNATMIYLVDRDFNNPQLSLLAPQGFSLQAFLLMVLVTGTIAPFVEEITFRGVLLRWLEPRFGAVVAIATSSLLFATVHTVPMLIPALTVAGIAFALISRRSGSLWPAIILHGAFNMTMTSLLFFALAQQEAQGNSLTGF
ncbi:CPBP family intramembrane glutamic endopeptidase [Kiloniella laminariae]|uniref:CPBP family intramembrane glutamic endopeptidase n=1 Tax=Kiloniella laminariae TaxID=454162 RepID=UPI00037D4DB8|nr:CPBP family intramembrane glutamic endopeptidase [Kiloniella laminariae]